MRVLFDIFNGRYKVSAFNDVHTHKLVTPEKKKMMRSMRKMPMAVRKLTESCQAEEVRVSSLPNLFGGDSIGFDSRDCYNHLRKLRHKALEAGDAQSVVSFFQQKQAENPHFFYAIQCDEEGRAVNFFWVDAHSRMAYQCFGDVVTFVNDADSDYAEALRLNHLSQEMSKLACISAPHRETYVIALDMVNETMKSVGVVIDSIMKTRARTKVASDGLVKENTGAEAFPSTQNNIGVVASNISEL